MTVMDQNGAPAVAESGLPAAIDLSASPEIAPRERPRGVSLASDEALGAQLHRRLAWRRKIGMVLFAVDLAAVGVGVVVAYLLRIVVADDEAYFGPYFYPALAVLTIVAWMSALALVHAYETRFLGVGAEEFRRVVVASAAVFVTVAVFAYSFRFVVPRGFVAIALPVGLGLLVLGRFLVRKWIQRQRLSGHLQHRVVVIGNHLAAQTLADQVRREPFAGFTVVGVCLPARQTRHPEADLPILGCLDDAVEAVRAVGADTVAVTASPEISPELLRQIAWSLEGSGIDLIVAPAVTDVAGPRISVRPVAGLPLLYVDEPSFSGTTRVVKRGIDLIGAGFGVLVLGVPLLIVAAVIRLTSPGPALFRQQRIGRDGEAFTVLKFRSMYQDAEERWAELHKRNENGGLLFKMTDDPRVTPLGKFLRRTSVDEMPQLVNVLLGQMSLVGPRPLAVDDSEMAGHVRRRLLVRPGLTGLWQVSGRKNVSWEEAVRMDLYYVENWSLSMDFTILMRTMLAVWRGEGAY